MRVVLTHVMPPLEFVASREARRLATLQRAEEQEHHALAQLRQADREELTGRIAAARGDRAGGRERGRPAGAARERIRLYPNAMHWDVESKRLEVARSLAANTRAMVNVGPGADVAAALLNHTLPENGVPPQPRPSRWRPAEAPDAGAKPAPSSRPKR